MLDPSALLPSRPSAAKAPATTMAATTPTRSRLPIRRPGVAIAEHEAARAQDRGERHGRKLPVPVAARVDEKDDVRPERRSRQREGPATYRRHDGEEQRRREQRKPERPELCERLDVEAVGVANTAHGGRLVLQENTARRFRRPSRARDGLFASSHATRHRSYRPLPEKVEEPLVEIRAVGGRRLEGAPALLDERRPSEANDDADEDDRDEAQDSGGEDPAKPLGHPNPALGQGECRGDRRSERHEDEQDQRQAMAVSRGLGERRGSARQSVKVRGRPHREREDGREREDDPEQLEAALVDRDRGEHAGTEGEPAGATEGEVERREEERQDRRAGCPNGCRPAPCRVAERQKHSHRREDGQAVPVAERLSEPVRGRGVEHRIRPGKRRVARLKVETAPIATTRPPRTSETVRELARAMMATTPAT